LDPAACGMLPGPAFGLEDLKGAEGYVPAQCLFSLGTEVSVAHGVYYLDSCDYSDRADHFGYWDHGADMGSGDA
jgi:hypothetical protein